MNKRVLMLVSIVILLVMVMIACQGEEPTAEVTTAPSSDKHVGSYPLHILERIHVHDTNVIYSTREILPNQIFHFFCDGAGVFIAPANLRLSKPQAAVQDRRLFALLFVQVFVS